MKTTGKKNQRKFDFTQMSVFPHVPSAAGEKGTLCPAVECPRASLTDMKCLLLMPQSRSVVGRVWRDRERCFTASLWKPGLCLCEAWPSYLPLDFSLEFPESRKEEERGGSRKEASVTIFGSSSHLFCPQFHWSELSCLTCLTAEEAG